jgi:hypothetical protein
MKRKKISSFAPGLAVKAFNVITIVFGVFLHMMAIRQAMGGWLEFPLPLILLIAALDAYLLWWMIIYNSQTQVTLYDEGIEIERGASKLFTPWENVSHLGKKPLGGGVATGLYLYEPVKTEAEGLIEGLLFRENGKFIQLGRYVNLPSDWKSFFSSDVDRERILETDIGKQLYELAPRLFDETPKLKNRLEETDESEIFDYEEGQNQRESKA